MCLIRTKVHCTVPIKILNYPLSIFFLDPPLKVNSDVTSSSNYNRFQNILRELLDNHAPLKKKYVRANNSPFMTKSLQKMIMNRSRSKNKYFKNKTAEHWKKYRKLRNECVSLTKKVKREYFQNLNINSINDNKTFWKTVKPFHSNNGNINQKKILVENNEIIRDDKKKTQIL